MILEEVKASGVATLSVRKAASLLGIAESTAWRAIRSGAFPVVPLWIGQRCLIPARPLIRLLEGDEVAGPRVTPSSS
jgi:hypothetical protein